MRNTVSLLFIIVIVFNGCTGKRNQTDEQSIEAAASTESKKVSDAVL